MVPCEEIKVILLDDEEGFRQSLAELLRDDGHDVSDFRAPASIPDLGSLARGREHTLVVVTDYEMPGETGIAFADAVHAAHPNVPIVLVTAYHTHAMDSQIAAREGFLTSVRKPVDYEDLHRLIHDRAAAAIHPSSTER